MKKKQIDIRVENHGSVVLLRPESDRGRNWLKGAIAAESWQWFGGAVACEPRYVADIIEGAQADWLEVR